MKTYIVYGLSSASGAVRYVGMTGRAIKLRFSEHLRSIRPGAASGKGAGSGVVEWIKSEGPDSIFYVIFGEFDNVEDAAALEYQMVEQSWINGGELLNKNPGGLAAGPRQFKMCRKGLHEMVGENVYLVSNGSGRKCRLCSNLVDRERYKTKRLVAKGSSPDVEVYFNGNAAIRNPTLIRYFIDRKKMDWSLGEISRECGVAVDRVAYCLKNYVANGETVRYAGKALTGSEEVWGNSAPINKGRTK